MRAEPTTRTFCTIYNSAYAIRGLGLLASLARHCPDHRIYVFAMDAATTAVLEAWNDDRVIVVRPAEFEGPDLLKVKPTRSVAEYFWTCTPSIIHHCLTTRGAAECTYVDADVWLMSDPSPIYDEMGENSVLLTEHRYARRYGQLATAYGKYCVQFMRFVGTERGMKALEWWRDRCLEWCHAEPDAGRFGDQKYLDDWIDRFPGVHVLGHLGGGVAPWNVSRYSFSEKGGRVFVQEGAGAPWPVLFFHFHGMRNISDDAVCFGDRYALDASAKKHFFIPYVLELDRLLSVYGAALGGVAARRVTPGASNDGTGLKRLLKRLRGVPNTYSIRRLARNAIPDQVSQPR
jgi:hypothetical protein